jgi:hypothetical protein
VLRSSAWVTVFVLGRFSSPKTFAAFEMIGMSPKGLVEFGLMMEFCRIEPWMKMAEPSNPTRLFSSGAGMLATMNHWDNEFDVGEGCF